MTIPVRVNPSTWVCDRDPSTSEPGISAPIEKNDEFVNTVSGETFLCTNADNQEALVWISNSPGSPKSFTPTIVGNTSAGTASYSVQIGSYIKIGSAILMTISLTWSSHTGTGTMSIGGLPINPTTSYVQKQEIMSQSIALPLLSLSTWARTNASTNRLDVVTMIANAVEANVNMSASGNITLKMLYFF